MDAHRAVLGDLAPLTNALSRGIEFTSPIVAYQRGIGWTLLAGERRWAAMIRIGVPLKVYMARGWDDFMTWMIQDYPNPGATPMNPVDAAHLSIKVRDLLNPRRQSNPDETIASYVQVDVNDMRATRSLIENWWRTPGTPEEIKNEAAQQLREIAAGAVRPWSAHERMKRVHNRLHSVPGPISKQRSILGNAASMSTGLADALATLGPISDELGVVECDELIRKLGDGRRALERVIRSLKERRAAQ